MIAGRGHKAKTELLELILDALAGRFVLSEPFRQGGLFGRDGFQGGVEGVDELNGGCMSVMPPSASEGSSWFYYRQTGNTSLGLIPSARE